ncbi:MAG: cytochrome c biogenesis protein CcsA [Mucinivorans sp.]
MRKLTSIISGAPLMAVLLIIYAVLLGAATFVEHAAGTPVAMNAIYKSWWFFAFQALMVVNFVMMAHRLTLFKRHRWGVLLLHYGFVVILAGAMVTFLTGVEGMVHIRQGEQTTKVSDMTGRTVVAELPFAVHLDKFTIARYGHSGSPSSFVSRVTIEGESHEISMNNVLYHGAWRFYQTSFDKDEKGTFLTASRDVAGVAITYTGYIMLCLGLILSLAARGSRFRRLAASLGVVVAGMCTAFGAENEVVAKFERLLVQEPSGRVVSVGSYAEDVVRKVMREKTYNGMSASEMLLGITTNPAYWAQQKIVRDTTGGHIAFADLIGPKGEYLLSGRVEAIYRLAPRARTKADKEVLKLDERINILDNLFSGRMLALFPRQGTARWYSSGEDLSDFASWPKDSLLASKIFPWFSTELVAGNGDRAVEILDMIEIFQKAKSDQVNATKIEAELLYNKLDAFKWSGFSFMTLGLLLSIILILTTVGGSRSLRIVFWSLVALAGAVFLFQSFALGLRWYISGRAPWTNAYESMVYVSWAAAVAGFTFLRKSKITFALAIFLAGVLLFVSTLNWMDPQITPLAPVLDSYWLIIHVAVITASYAFFAIGFLLGVAAMIVLATKQTETKRQKIKELTTINQLSLNVGLVLMTIGTFLGAVWANESWGRYWGWDPKETWALVTVVVYAFVTHSYMIRRLARPYFTALLSIVALLTVLMTFFGVNYYLSGMHSYGSDSAPEALWLIYYIYGALALLSLVPLFRGNYRA